MYVTWFTRSVYEATTHMIAICYLRFKDKSHPLSANLISYIQFTLTIFHKKLIPAFCSQTSVVYFNQRFVANSKKPFLAKIFGKFVTFLNFLSFFAWKMLKMNISTSAWHAQHQSAGWNIQQTSIGYSWNCFSNCAQLNVSPNYLFVYILHFGCPFFACVTFSYLFYARNQDLRDTLNKEIRDLISNRFC